MSTVFFVIIITAGLTLLTLAIYNPFEDYLYSSSNFTKANRAAANPTAGKSFHDLNYALYTFDGDLMPDFSRIRADQIGSIDTITLLDSWKNKEFFAVKFFGSFNIRYSGNYRFFIQGNKRCKLYIDDEYITADHSRQEDQTNGILLEFVNLSKGRHQIELQYFDRIANLDLALLSRSPQEKDLTPLTKNDFKFYFGAENDAKVNRLENNISSFNNYVNGLLVFYFDNIDFSGTSTIQKSRHINFNWHKSKPMPNIQPYKWSAHMIGQIKAKKSNNYRFRMVCDDGAKLWIDGKLIINLWPNARKKRIAGNIELDENRYYSFELKYFNDDGPAKCQLFWASDDFKETIVPSECFYTMN